MPIRLNFLAEQQAAEELKRRDPVKRVLWLVSLIVGAMILWGVSLQFRLFRVKGQTAGLEATLKQLDPVYRSVLSNQSAVSESALRIAALESVRSNRFLWANVLNALQHAVMTDVRLVDLRVDQSYALTDAVPAKTNQTGQVISPAKPAVSTERIKLEIQARDQSANPGDAMKSFPGLLSQIGYMRTNFSEPKLISTSQPQADPESSNRYVLFTMECQRPETARTPVK